MLIYFLVATTLTLRGSSYVSYRVYDWKDRVHSSVNRISLQFRVSDIVTRYLHVLLSTYVNFVLLDLGFDAKRGEKIIFYGS